MAVKKTIALAGGFQAPAYLMIRSARLDAVTGEIEYIIWSFPDEESRRDYSASLADVTAAQALMKEPYDPKLSEDVTGKEHTKVALGRMQVAKLASERVSQCNEGSLYANVTLHPNDAALAIKDGVASVAALYGLAKQDGAPLAGGEDC